ncbi:hypothetical protein, partial [Streptococcus anginosus]
LAAELDAEAKKLEQAEGPLTIQVTEKEAAVKKAESALADAQTREKILSEQLENLEKLDPEDVKDLLATLKQKIADAQKVTEQKKQALEAA